MGRLAVAYDENGNAALYHYDAVGNLLSIQTYSPSQPGAFRLSSPQGDAGATITIYGIGFCSEPTVTFDGTAATVVSSSSTQIVVTVPGGAASGEVVVTCGSSNLDAGVFVVAGSGSTPTISGFSPASGASGTSVTITGTNIQPDGTNITFNNSPALVTASTSTSITAVVPSGATSGSIGLFDQYGQATSGSNFIVLPPGTVDTGQITVNGSPTAATFDTGGQLAVLTFQGTAAEQVLVSFDDPQLDCASSATVYAPDNSVLGAFNNLCDGVGYLRLALPSNGVYSVIVNDGYDAGSLSVAVDDIGQLPTISPGGAAVNVDIPVAQTAALAFSGNAGDQISLLATFANLTWPEISIIAPDGSNLGTAVTDYQSIQYLNAVTLPASGTYLVVGVSSNQDIIDNTDDTFSLQLYDAPTLTQSISVGGPTISLTPSVPGQTAALSFSGTAGQTVSYEFTSAYCPNAQFANPDGSMLYDSGSCTWDTSDNQFASYSGAVVLPADGTYQLDIDFLGQIQTANVNLYDATPQNGTIAIDGSPVALSTNPGQIDNLSFSGTAGQQVSLASSASTYPAGIIINVLNPDGSMLNNFGFWDSADDSDAFSLPNTGTYVVQVAGGGLGTANLALYDATPVTGSITVDGPTVSMSTNPGQPLELAFSGTAGTQPALGISNLTYGRISVSVFNPDGSSLVSGLIVSGGSLESIPSLPTTGTYTVELVGDPGPGSASVQLFSSNSQNLTTTIGGAPVDVAVSLAGQNVNITFSADAGQWISMGTSNSTFSGCVDTTLLNPDGSWANEFYACDPNGVMGATRLATSGTYTIFMNLYGSTGDIDLRLNDATPTAGGMTIDGPQISSSMSTPWQNFEYTFSGSSGQQIGLAVTNFSYSSCNPLITLFDSNGNSLDWISLDPSSWPDGTATLSNGVDALPSDGTYSVFVDDSGCTSGSSDLQVYSSPTLSGTISINGPSVTATSSVPGQPTQLTFSGSANQSVSLSTTNSTYSDCAYLELDDPNGGYVDSDSTCSASSNMGPDTLNLNGTYSLKVQPYGAAGSIDLSLSGQ